MYRQRAEIMEFIHHRLSLNPDSFDRNQLKTIKFGRPQKKKSIKVKRTAFEVLLIAYILPGLLVWILRSYIRRKNTKVRLNALMSLITIIGWPKILLNILYKLSQIYYYGK